MGVGAFGHGFVLYVANDADDAGVVIGPDAVDGEAAAERIFVREITASQFLADDDDRCGVGRGVRFSELATANERNAHQMKIVRRDGVRESVERLSARQRGGRQRSQSRSRDSSRSMG